MASAYVESIGGCSGVGPLRPEKTLGECLDRSPAGPFPARGAGRPDVVGADLRRGRPAGW